MSITRISNYESSGCFRVNTHAHLDLLPNKMRAAGRLSGGIFFTLLPAIVSQGSAVRPSIPAVSLRGAAATLYPVGSHHHQAVPSFTSSLADDLTAGLQPILRNLSAVHNDSAWAFSYRDADVTLDLCAGWVHMCPAHRPLQSLQSLHHTFRNYSMFQFGRLSGLSGVAVCSCRLAPQ